MLSKKIYENFKIRVLWRRNMNMMFLLMGLVVLLIVVAGLIQIPAIQTKIVHSATTFVSKKTHTRVEIKNISISFPKSIVVEGLFLEDTQKDTLIYAKKAKINFVFIILFALKV